MVWTVLGAEKDKVLFVSKSGTDGILHQGSYLTIIDGSKKFIVRVDESSQYNPYSPSPLIVDMDLSPLLPDQKAVNITNATRIIEYPEREDGMSSFIKPQLTARRSGQEDIDMAIGNKEGIPIFPATAFARNIQNLCDEEGKFLQVKIPKDTFFYQMLIAGRTGSGKTVAMKYMAQYFIEEMGGCVLAINVKEEDLLTMDKPSKTKNPKVLKEWSDLKFTPRGLDTFRVYYPCNQNTNYSTDVDLKKCEKITLVTKHIDPETLTGLIQNLSDLGADHLPQIFRYWKQEVMENNSTMTDFLNYLAQRYQERTFPIMNIRGDILEPIRLFPGTYNNIYNSLNYATNYFDVEEAKELEAKDILQRGKMSVIDVTGKGGFTFGSILLRDLLDKIYDAKSNKSSKIPILIIIDEVHEFYNTTRSREALQTLDSICRKGRSLEIGIIFSSQNPEDIPKGISNVVNSKIYFKSESSSIKSLGTNVSGIDTESFKQGYAVARIHSLSQLKFLKFPMSLAGVNDDRGK